jgi:hypothetical protein
MEFYFVAASVRKSVYLGAPAPRSEFEDVRMIEQPIQERGDGGRVHTYCSAAGTE